MGSRHDQAAIGQIRVPGRPDLNHVRVAGRTPGRFEVTDQGESFIPGDESDMHIDLLLPRELFQRMQRSPLIDHHGGVRNRKRRIPSQQFHFQNRVGGVLHCDARPGEFAVECLHFFADFLAPFDIHRARVLDRDEPHRDRSVGLSRNAAGQEDEENHLAHYVPRPAVGPGWFEPVHGCPMGAVRGFTFRVAKIAHALDAIPTRSGMHANGVAKHCSAGG